MTRTRKPALLAALAVAACAEPTTPAADLAAAPASAVRSFAEVDASPGEWGSWHPYFLNDTTYTRDHITGVAVLNPGHTNHPAHRHAEEEVLMVTHGEGTWTLNDRSFPAKAGDILYARPWDLHGVFNSGSEELRFVVVKFNPAGLAPPPDPNPQFGEFGLGPGIVPE